MRKILILIIFIFIGFHLSYSQGLQINNKDFLWNPDDSITHRKVNYDPVFFVLGTLSDYLGHFQYVDREKQVDRYYPYQRSLVDYLTKYIKVNLNIKVDTVFEKSGHCEMYSDTLSKILNNFYDEKGLLINSLFKTNEQICSFIAGVYYRDGKKIDTLIYKIQLYNSPKNQNCYELLKQIGCNRIFFQYSRGFPSVYILYFKPTKELDNYLYSIEEENKELNKWLYQTKYKIFKDYISKEEWEKEIIESNSKELIIIKNAFNL